MEGMAQRNDLCPVLLRYKFLIHGCLFLSEGCCSALLSHFLMVLQIQQKKNNKRCNKTIDNKTKMVYYTSCKK